MLRDIGWESDPFKLLQLSDDRKLLVHRLVKGFNNSNADVYDDIINGKGKGLIFLLHGLPGLGKTLTDSMFFSVQKTSHLASAVNRSDAVLCAGVDLSPYLDFRFLANPFSYIDNLLFYHTKKLLLLGYHTKSFLLL